MSTGPTTERWVWVSLAYATFALGIKNGQITDAPPIARWTIGRPEREVANYYRRKGARFASLTEHNGEKLNPNHQREMA